MIVNANSVVQDVIQIKNGIVIPVDVSYAERAKKIIIGILKHVFVRIVGF